MSEHKMTAGAIKTAYGYKPVIKHELGFCRTRTERVGGRYAPSHDMRDSVLVKASPNLPNRDEAIAYAQRVIDARFEHQAKVDREFSERQARYAAHRA